ncbi:MAG: hypothetical protein HRT65_01100 [Flavobacteriaceae bacterium]|nr:hypothetical protein [Flavobacteriaceae bacterium]
MKNTLTTLVLALLGWMTLNAQTACSQYYPLVEGASMTYENFNKKGKSDGTIAYQVTDVETGGTTESALMVMTISDKKGNTFNSEYAIRCEGDVVKIDFKSLMNEQMLSQFGEMDMDVSGTDIELPNNLEVGQQLPDANMNIKVTMGGAMTMNMNVETINRKVEKMETVTTPAGTFECYVLYSDTKTKMMMGKQTFPSRTWLAKGVGMVKQETYNKSGKLMGSTVLSQYSS